jgi:hypothetical protein
MSLPWPDLVATTAAQPSRFWGSSGRKQDALETALMTYNVTSPSQIGALRKLVRPDGR